MDGHIDFGNVQRVMIVEQDVIWGVPTDIKCTLVDTCSLPAKLSCNKFSHS